MRYKNIANSALRSAAASRKSTLIEPRNLRRYLKDGNPGWLAANESAQHLQELADAEAVTFTFLYVRFLSVAGAYSPYCIAHDARSHMPGHQASERILRMFQKELEEEPSPAPASASPSFSPARPPAARARLEVLQRVPSVDEWQTLLRCKNRVPGFLPFLTCHPRSVHPTTASQMHDALAATPAYLRWPLVVNWATGDVACGKDRSAHKGLLRPLRIHDALRGVGG